MDAFHSRYDDLRHANDDTPLLRWIAEREPIHISPRFSCVYAPRERARRASCGTRSTAGSSSSTGTAGRSRASSRPWSPSTQLRVVAAASLRRPALGLLALAGVGAAAGALGLERRRTPFEVATLAAVTPVYAVAHGAGMWRGLGLLLAERLRRRG